MSELLKISCKRFDRSKNSWVSGYILYEEGKLSESVLEYMDTKKTDLVIVYHDTGASIQFNRKDLENAGEENLEAEKDKDNT